MQKIKLAVHTSLRPVMTFLLAAFMLLGDVAPLLANGNMSTSSATYIEVNGENIEVDGNGNFVVSVDTTEELEEQLIITFNGEEVELPENGIITTTNDRDEEVKHFINHYVWVDGERVRIDDERILNITPVFNNSFHRSSTPPVTHVLSMSGSFAPTATVTLNGTTVSGIRYVAFTSNGHEYEAFCADPLRAGPEVSGDTGYGVLGTLDTWRNALKFGFPTNPHLTSGTQQGNINNAYATRVAVAMGRHAPSSFGGNQSVRGTAQQLTQGGQPNHQNFDTTHPPITVNGVRDAAVFGDANGAMAESGAFTIGYNRRTNRMDNPFFFEWDSITPAGTQLFVNGTLVATAPTNPTTMYTQQNITSFELKMPTSAGTIAKINLVGVNNAWADQVWVLRNTNNPSQSITQAPTAGQRQDIVFFIPPVNASATMRFEPEQEGRLRIIKQDNNGNSLDGAVFEVTDPEGNTIEITVNGSWTSDELTIFGEYTITEIKAPAGHQLASPVTQTVNVEAGSTETATVTFINPTDDVTTNPPPSPPPTEPECPEDACPEETTNLKVQKVDAISKELVSGALVEIRGISPTNTHIVIQVVLSAGAELPIAGTNAGYAILGDGWVELYNIPVGTYQITEISPPQNYSMLPHPNRQVIDTEECDEGTILTIVTLENYPYGRIELEKIDEVTGEPVVGARLRIQGFSPENAVDGLPIDRTLTTDANGRITFIDLPAGMYSISEVFAPEGYILSTETISVPLAWGQAATVTFVNTPLASFDVIKIDGDNGITLAGARFTLRDPVTGNAWEAISNTQGIATFTGLIPNKTYILTETQAPNGYVLHSAPREVVITNDGRNEIIIRNFRNPGLTIIKRDKDTQERLAGAVFEVSYENGTTIAGSPFTTDSNGEIKIPEILFENNAERTLIITETIPPAGYNLADPNWQRVTIRQGEDNVVVFENIRKSTLTIRKIDARLLTPIPNTQFTVEKLEAPNAGMLTGNPFRTNAQGEIVLPILYSGKYRITETRPAQGYNLASPNSWIIEVKDNEDYLFVIENTKLPTLILTKFNALTNRPVPHTHFRISYEVPNSNRVELIGNFVTNANGQIVLPNMRVGWYIWEETRPAPGMSSGSNPRGRIYLSEGDNTYTLNPEQLRPPTGTTPPPANAPITTPPTGGIADGNNPIEVDRPEGNQTPVNPNNPTPPTSPNTTNVTVTDGNDWLIGEGVYNWPLNSIVIKKSDAVTGELLQGATFNLRRVALDTSGTSGTLIGTYTTGRSGIIVITGLEPGGYIVEETIPPTGYLLSENNRQQVWLAFDGTSIVELNYHNYPYGSLLIAKNCSVTGIPLQNARFRVTNADGTLVGSTNGIFTTNAQGEILIPSLKPDSYVITEIQAPNGYILDSTPQTVRIGIDGRTHRIEFTNSPEASLLIVKVDSTNNRPLAGARFRVERADGTVVGNSNGIFVTGANGEILIPSIEPGAYVVTEIEAPAGFILDNTPQTIHINADGRIYRLEFRNDPLNGIEIIKLNSSNRQPIAGVEFSVSRTSGEHVGNFRTDNSGRIFIPNLCPDTYVVVETRAANGFILDAEPRNVVVRSGEVSRLEVLNDPQGGLLIIKTDAQTGLPLAGVVFDVKHADGRRVTGAILDGNQPNTPNNSPNLNTGHNGTIAGSFVTDERGRINLNHLVPGVYHVTETQALSGYELDTTVHTVTVIAGEQAVLRVENVPLSGLRLLKIDSITRQPIYNVEFMVFDHNGKVVGVFYTDNQGLIDFPAILVGGRYTIRETRPAPGYSRDDIPRTVEFVPGRITEIVWENIPITGQLQILKVSADYNLQNALPAGTPLAGAIFEIYSHRTGNLVDRIISDGRGMAVSKPLPLGRYYAIEVQAPAFYQINPQRIDFDIEHERQIVRVTFPNLSANTGVTIRKVGPLEVMQGHAISYEIAHLRNDSNIPLADFYWRDILPVEAVRVNRLVTGTFNSPARYRIMGKTNTGREIVIADNLQSTRNNVIEMRPVHLGLASNEFVVEFIVLFGQVPAGFMAVEKPRVFVDVLPRTHTILPNGMMFANRVDTGGRVPGSDEWVVGNSTAASTIFGTATMPRSGF